MQGLGFVVDLAPCFNELRSMSRWQRPYPRCGRRPVESLAAQVRAHPWLTRFYNLPLEGEHRDVISGLAEAMQSRLVLLEGGKRS